MSLIMLGPTTTEPAPFRGTRSASASTSLPCALPQVASPPDDRGTMFRTRSERGPLCPLSAAARFLRPLDPLLPILELWLAQTRRKAAERQPQLQDRRGAWG